MIRTILLAEDDKGTALFVRTSLQKHGYHVLWAANGLEAMTIVNKHPVDLIVTDVVMPHMDGVDLYEELKKNPQTQHIPVIIITDKQLFKDSFSALGVDHFIPKSSDITALLDKIKNISTDLQKKNFPKVLISGGNRRVLDQMQKMLIAKQCLTAVADNSLDTIHKAFLMSPHIVLLDVRMSDNAQTKEVVSSLRCFHFFHKLQILTYAFLTPEEMGVAGSIWEIIEHDANLCAQAGATAFIGNFTQGNFLDLINPYFVENNS